MPESPSIISHLSVPVSSVEKAKAFYDVVLATIGGKVVYDHEGQAFGYGKHYPEFWIHRPANGEEPSSGNGWHAALIAATPKQVDEFHAAALAAGGTDEGAPGPRPQYGPQYYGCFVRDLDGNKIEAAYWDEGGGA